MANNKTPKAAAAKPNGNASAAKGKSESQLQQEAKSRQTPAKQLTKKKEEEDSDSDSDDEEEKKVLASSKKTPAADKKADPQDEEMDEEDDEDEEDYEDDDTLIVDLAERLRFGFQQGITIPAGSQVLVQAAIFGDASYPFHITNACLGPDAEDDDRACLILQQESMFSDDHNHDHDEEDEEDEEHDHDDEEDDEDEGDLMEIVCGALCKNKTENLSLDLVLNGDFLLVNTSEKTDIYITGRLLVDDDEDEEYDEMEEEEIDEDGEGEISRASLDDEEDEEDDEEEEDEESEEEEEDKAAAAARRQDVRKRLLVPSEETKKPKMEPKVIDVKPTEKKAASGDKKAPPTAEAVRDFILAELKTKKTIKNTELGTLVSGKFGMAFKQMGFPEKSMTQFLQVHAKGKAEASGDSVKLI